MTLLIIQITVDILNQVIGKIRELIVQLEPSSEAEQITTYFNVILPNF